MIFVPCKGCIKLSKHSHRISSLLLFRKIPSCHNTHHPHGNGIEWQGASIDLRYTGISSEIEITMIITMNLKGQRPRSILKEKSSGMSTTSTMLFGNWNNLPLFPNICFEGLLSVSSLIFQFSGFLAFFVVCLCWPAPILTLQLFIAFNEIAAHDVDWGSSGVNYDINEAWEFNQRYGYIPGLVRLLQYIIDILSNNI